MIHTILGKKGEKNRSGKDTANIITNKYNTAGGSEPFPGLQWHLSCFSVLIISTAARSAVNNIFSAGVHQALNLYFTPHIKKTPSLSTLLIPSDNSSQIISLHAQGLPKGIVK